MPPRILVSLIVLLPCLASGLAAAQADEPRMRVAVEGAPGRGAADPLVTIVEFSDFQCPFCVRVQETLRAVLQAHPGEVRLVFRHNPLPFHRDAAPAAELAIEAQAQRGEAGFWQVHDRLFADPTALGTDDLLRIAQQVGLDPSRVRQALQDGRHRARIADEQRRASEIGAQGTPTFFVNGRRLVGAQPLDAFERLIAQELAEARALVSRGVARGRVYDRLMATAADRAPERPVAPNSDARPAPPDVVVRVPVDGSPQLGPDDALVTLVVFSEFQCPFCARLRPTLSALRERFGRELRIVWKHQPLPFHDHAMPAALAAQEAFAQGGSAGFWRMHDELFDHQQVLDRDGLLAAGRRAGLDDRRLRAGLESAQNRAVVDRDLALANDIGVRGTPISFINGRRLSGAQPLDTFVAAVDHELAAARARVRGGTPRARIYETLPIGAPVAEIAGSARPPAPSDPPARAEPQPRVAIAIPRSTPSQGPARAPVTVQVFGDFQCPFTSVLRPTLIELRRRFPSEVRVVWRHYPLSFHPHARLAAEAAVEAHRQGGDAMFWSVLDRLFDRQAGLTPEAIREVARESGMDPGALEAALRSGRHRRRVEADMRALDRVAGASGTPTIVVAGRILTGAQPVDAFAALVEEALAERRARRR